MPNGVILFAILTISPILATIFVIVMFEVALRIGEWWRQF